MTRQTLVSDIKVQAYAKAKDNHIAQRYNSLSNKFPNSMKKWKKHVRRESI